MKGYIVAVYFYKNMENYNSRIQIDDQVKIEKENKKYIFGTYDISKLNIMSILNNEKSKMKQYLGRSKSITSIALLHIIENCNDTKLKKKEQYFINKFGDCYMK